MSYIVKLKCDACNSIFDVDLENYDIVWEVADTFDHGDNAMGEELHHEAVIDVSCPDCEKDDIQITLSVWEYPVGAYNNQEIGVDGAELVLGCDIQGLAPIGDIE